MSSTRSITSCSRRRARNHDGAAVRIAANRGARAWALLRCDSHPLRGDRVLERSQVVPVGVEEAFAFFADPWNLEAITPPWLRFHIVQAPPTLERGSLLAYQLQLFGVPIRWRTEIVDWRPPSGFTDVQLAGPYRRWEHTHRSSPGFRRNGDP